MHVSVSMPEDVRERPTGELAKVSLPSLSGLSLEAHRGWEGSGFEVMAACVRAPSDGWAPGVEALVLGRATQLAHGAMGSEIGAIRTGEPVVEGDRFRQSFEADGKGADGPLRVSGTHVLGFAGAGGREAVLCTVICEQRADRGADVCGLTTGAVDAGGAWTAAPAPSVLARAVLLVAERPVEALGGAAVVALAAVWVILARRPRSRVS